MKIAIEDLRKHISLTLETKGFSENEVTAIADYLLWAEQSGNKTQGIIKLTGTGPLQDIKATSDIIVEKDTKISQLIDGGANPAPIVATVAMESVIEKAKDIGFAIVGARNTFSSNGAQAYYVEKIAKEELIGIMCSRSPAATSGFGSIDPLFGTNPIGFGFPANDHPVVFDMATSAMTFYGLILAKSQGESISENMALDSSGDPTVNPEKAMDGSLLPFDRGHKGAGLAMVIEILTGPLIGSSWIDNDTFEEEWGTTFIAIDPEILIGTENFKNNVSDLISKIKNSKGENIRIPGSKAVSSREDSEKSGFVDVDEVLLKDLNYI